MFCAICEVYWYDLLRFVPDVHCMEDLESRLKVLMLDLSVCPELF